MPCDYRYYRGEDNPLDKLVEAAMMLVACCPGGSLSNVVTHFGRGNTAQAPLALREPGPLSNSEGSVLDPVVAIRYRIVLLPGRQSVALKLGEDKGTPETVWKAAKLTGGYPSPLIYQGRVYGLTGVGLVCVSAKDGSDVWVQRLPGPFAASPMISKFRITVLDQPLAHEVFAPAGHISLYSGDAVSDVSQIGKIGPHKGRASASI